VQSGSEVPIKWYKLESYEIHRKRNRKKFSEIFTTKQECWRLRAYNYKAKTNLTFDVCIEQKNKKI